MKPALLPWLTLIISLIIAGVLTHKFLEALNHQPKQLKNE